MNFISRIFHSHKWVYEFDFGKFFKSCKCGKAKRVSVTEYFENKKIKQP